MIQKITSAIFVYLLSCTLVVAQTAALLPNALQQYFDANGNPLSGGTVTFYYPGTLNLKPIWQDALEATPYSNPLTLNAAGEPPSATGIYGQGTYRQIVKDISNNTIWDAVTAAPGTFSQAGTGDGNLVGTVLPWAGIQAPNQYLFAFGQQISRTTYSVLLTAVTQTTPVVCTSGSNVLTGISDTTQIPVGAPVEVSCVVPGTTVSSKTSSSVTVSNNSSVSLNTSATFFPFGNGDGSTTFGLPDFRGNVVAGRPNMGGTASTNLTNAFCANPTALGAVCGSQSKTLTSPNLPNVALTGTFAATNTYAPGTLSLNQPVYSPNPSTAYTIGGGGTISSITATVTLPSYTPTGSVTGINLNGSVTQTAFSLVQPTITLNYIIKVLPDVSSAIANGVTSLGSMTGSIACGTGLTCIGNVISFGGINTPAATFSGNPTNSSGPLINFTIQGLTARGAPDANNDKIILYDNAAGTFKYVTPGLIASSNTSGVTSFGGSTGALTINTSLNVSGTAVSAGLGVDANILNGQTTNYTVANTDCSKTIQLGTGATGFFTLTFPAVAGFDVKCSIKIIDGDTARGKAIVGLTGITKLYQGQTFTAKIVNGVWALFDKPTRYLVPVGSTLTMYFDKDRGTDTNDCLAVGTGACATSGQLMTDLAANIDNEGTVIFQMGCTATPCTYTDLPFQSTGYVGAGSVVIQGDIATNSNYIWTCATVCAGGAVININAGTGGIWTVQGFTLTSSLATGAGIQVIYTQSATVLHQKNTFGAFATGIAISCIGAAHVNDMTGGNYSITGGGNSFGSAQDNCILHFDKAVGTLSGTPAFPSGFVVAHGSGAIVGTDSSHWSGAATGPHCASTLLGLIDTAGTSGSMPGNSVCNPASGVNTTVGSLGYVN